MTPSRANALREGMTNDDGRAALHDEAVLCGKDDDGSSILGEPPGRGRGRGRHQLRRPNGTEHSWHGLVWT